MIVFTASSTGRPRGTTSDRTRAAASSLTFFPIVFGSSSPPPPTGEAAPVFVPGAIAATSQAIRMMNPAEAAWEPGGWTKPTTGTSEARIAFVISRVESSRPPGVLIRRTTTGAPPATASSTTLFTNSAVTGLMSVSRSTTTASVPAPRRGRGEQEEEAQPSRSRASPRL